MFLLQVHQYQASRPISELLQSSLQRGPVPPSGASGCTHVPGSNGPACPSLVNQMNFAMHRHPHEHPGPASSSYPGVMIRFGLAG
ncbi:hypothetical protein LINGRAHAP2_LOCUS15571 [Linum grandiflorum]